LEAVDFADVGEPQGVFGDEELMSEKGNE